MEAELQACRRRAVGFKREGKLGEALSELKKAKALEKQLAETSGSSSGNTGLNSAAAAPAAASPAPPPAAPAAAPKPLKPVAPQRRPAPPPPPSFMSFGLEDDDDDDMGIFDDALLANLRSLGLAGPAPGGRQTSQPTSAKPAPAKPAPAKPAPAARSTGGVSVSGSGSGSGSGIGGTGESQSLQQQVMEQKRRAVELKRAGDTAGALAALKLAKQLQAQIG
ncbi:unnamed protein product [Closterium sp. NIES-54]